MQREKVERRSSLSSFSLFAKLPAIVLMPYIQRCSEGEGNIAVFSANCWDRRDRAGQMDSTIPCHNTQVVDPYLVSSPLCLTVLTPTPEDYTTEP